MQTPRHLSLEASIDPVTFWKRVRKTEGCWYWMGAKSDRYGHIRKNRQNIKAHRIAYAITYGQIPENRLIMHSCDTPMCVNPSHLRVGTSSENGRDMRDKSRMKNSKLNHETVSEIRRLWNTNQWTISALSRKFLLDRVWIRKIIKNQVWIPFNGK